MPEPVTYRAFLSCLCGSEQRPVKE